MHSIWTATKSGSAAITVAVSDVPRRRRPPAPRCAGQRGEPVLARNHVTQGDLDSARARRDTRRLLAQFLSKRLHCSALPARALDCASPRRLCAGLSRPSPGTASGHHRITVDGRVLLFAALIAIATSIVFGLTSFVETRRRSVGSALKSGPATSGASRGRRRFLNMLVVGEIAIALMLTFGAGLLIQSLHNLTSEKLGFDPTHLVLVETPFAPGSPVETHPWDFERRALERIEGIPGIQSAAVVSVAPLHGRNNFPAQRDGHPDNSAAVEIRSISPQYFQTMGIPIVRGRPFQDGDFVPTAPVVVIDEMLARAWWSGQDPLGDRLVVGEFGGHLWSPTAHPRTVVGVVGNVRETDVDQPARPMVYLPASDSESTTGSADFVVRAGVTPGMTPALRQAIEQVAPDQLVADVEPVSQLIGRVRRPTALRSSADGWIWSAGTPAYARWRVWCVELPSQSANPGDRRSHCTRSLAT